MKPLHPISNVIESLAHSRGWKERIEQERVLLLWPEIVGEITAAHARAERVERTALIVKTDSPVWSHTLSVMKTEILNRLKARIPHTKVRDIRFLCAEEIRQYRRGNWPSRR